MEVLKRILVVVLTSSRESLDLQACYRLGVNFYFDAVRQGKGSGSGFGLYNIEDRMTSLGGSMKVKTKPGKGCRVVINRKVMAAGTEGIALEWCSAFEKKGGKTSETGYGR
jgi:signal transduction histidine kinase